MDNKTTLLSQFIKIQEMQFKLDKKKQEYLKIVKEIRSMSQLIPRLLRELDLK